MSPIQLMCKQPFILNHKPQVFPNAEKAPAIKGVGSSQPKTSYTQEEVAKGFAIKNQVVKRFMNAPHIKKRHLILPDVDSDGVFQEESPHQLHQKQKMHGTEYGAKAVLKAVINAGLSLNEVDFICAVTSTGFLVPGLSSLIIKELSLRSNIQKLDIVGMGCNAGVSALIQVNNWSRANPGKHAVLVCVEISSAAYERDDSVRVGIVNSLFGDNASALVVHQGASRRGERSVHPKTIDFESLIIPDQIDAMKFDFIKHKNLNSFSLSKDIPFVIGKYVPIAIERLLSRNNLSIEHINHWVCHTGGAAVIRSLENELGLSSYDLRHTHSVLEDFGNVSSGSVFLSLERLLAEDVAMKGDIGVMVAMGPGSSIDAALLAWS